MGMDEYGSGGRGGGRGRRDKDGWRREEEEEGGNENIGGRGENWEEGSKEGVGWRRMSVAGGWRRGVWGGREEGREGRLTSFPRAQGGTTGRSNRRGRVRALGLRSIGGFGSIQQRKPRHSWRFCPLRF